MKTAIEIAYEAKLAKPHVRYAAANDNSCVVAWSDNRWVRVACLLIGNRGWASMPYELLVNGLPVPLPELTEV